MPGHAERRGVLFAMSKLSRSKLVELVRRIVAADALAEGELDAMLVRFADNVPHPSPSDLIYFPEDAAVSPERIVDAALSYIPIPLTHRS